MTKFYKACYKIASPIIRLIYRIKIIGEENIPESGNLVVSANHTSMFDVLVISSALRGYQVHYMAKKEIFKVPLVSSLVRALGAFPVNRQGADVSAIRKAISFLQNGETLGIFPQGTRRAYKNPRETEVRNGIGMILWHAKSDVLPVYIYNKKGKLKAFNRNTIIIGKPLPYDSLGYENGGYAEYTSVSNKVFNEICCLGEDYINANNKNS